MDLTQFVKKFYQMDPMSEALLANGRMLKGGMIVLIADPSLRSDPKRLEHDPDGGELYALNERNRWCIVGEIEIVDEEQNVYFTGTYDDGVEIRRNYPLLESWLVKTNGLNEDDYVDFVPAIVKQKEYTWLDNAGQQLLFQSKGRLMSPDPIPEGLLPNKPYTWNEEPERFENPSTNILRSRFNPPNQTVKLCPEQVNPHLHYPAAFTDFDPDKD